jgi:hypothetical protein
LIDRPQEPRPACDVVPDPSSWGRCHDSGVVPDGFTLAPGELDYTVRAWISTAAPGGSPAALLVAFDVGSLVLPAAPVDFEGT